MRTDVRLTPFPLAKSLLITAILLGCSPMSPLPWLPGIPASSAVSVDPNMIRISADQQNYSVDNKKYTLSGKVAVSYGNIRITGSKAEMEVDDNGKPSVAKFFNRPMFKRLETTSDKKGLEDQVVGDVIRLYLADDSFVSEGNVVSNIATVAADPFLIRSDIQQFDNRNKVVTARGNVAVDYQGSQAYSSMADVRMKADGKAERVIFTGGARIKKESSEIASDKITVMVDSGNLIAENGVKTRVDLKAKAADAPPKVYISSDYQQYDKSSDVMLASGHVKIVYGDYVAVGPKASFKLKDGDLDRIFLTGRPTITEKDRTITADKITITTNPKNFDAVGNVKVSFRAKDNPAPAASPTPAATAKSGKPGKPTKVASPAKQPSKPQLPEDDPSDY